MVNYIKWTWEIISWIKWKKNVSVFRAYQNGIKIGKLGKRVFIIWNYIKIFDRGHQWALFIFKLDNKIVRIIYRFLGNTISSRYLVKNITQEKSIYFYISFAGITNTQPLISFSIYYNDYYLMKLTSIERYGEYFIKKWLCL